MTKRSGFIIIVLVVVFGLVGNANATPIIGKPTACGSTTQVGIVDSNGKIKFFIPLDGADGTYGVDYVTGKGYYGTFADTTYVPPPIDGPRMNMYLLFNIPGGEIGHTLTLTFIDLDLIPWNDPDEFNERLIIESGDALPDGTYENYSDFSPGIVSSATDYNGSILTFTGLNIGSGNWWLCLGFEAYGDDDMGQGWWTNTVEYLTAKLDTTSSPVPEPATLLLLGFGFVGLAGLRRKFRRR